ncbi:hypothetical protein OQH60_05465 [Campylobacter sp. MIT 21-1685]|nr:hypothetical protein [Campylobacter sp. MIT 21-1684]MCX2751595.1 hypothetical protein [Campylobacter sp. MIT 21-1682]MCX2807794.1 hypothetical protein [Campylobacter sp. MIT 21-1685]
MRVVLLLYLPFLFLACTNNQLQNENFDKALLYKLCQEDFLQQKKSKKPENDSIYLGLNVALIARNCGDFVRSNALLDKVEESYKYEVDLENLTTKSAKLILKTFINENIFAYQGSLYERIMVNIYKALNFMNLNDFTNARVEINRALMRQEKAKEYFAKEIALSREKFDELKRDSGYLNENFQNLSQQYASLFREFHTSENFINGYASYIASVFFFLEREYKRSADLLKELVFAHPENVELQKEFQIFEKRANAINGDDKEKYIFLIYENGLGVVKDSFELTLPFLIDGKIIPLSVALQTLKKREGSFEFLDINGILTTQIVNLDDVVATEFQLTLLTMITKAFIQTLTKASLNFFVANSDSNGALFNFMGVLATVLTNKSDVRSWRALPQSISVAMLKNSKTIVLKNPQGREIFNTELDEKKNALIIVRSFSPFSPLNVSIIQK